MRVDELLGDDLDEAVAKCEKSSGHPIGHPAHFSPSTNWAQGGPIIERESISPAYEPSLLYGDDCRWKALSAFSDNDHYYGPTPLIAAMRCYVASHLGDEIELPEIPHE